MFIASTWDIIRKIFFLKILSFIISSELSVCDDELWAVQRQPICKLMLSSLCIWSIGYCFGRKKYIRRWWKKPSDFVFQNKQRHKDKRRVERVIWKLLMTHKQHISMVMQQPHKVPWKKKYAKNNTNLGHKNLSPYCYRIWIPIFFCLHFDLRVLSWRMI